MREYKLSDIVWSTVLNAPPIPRPVGWEYKSWFSREWVFRSRGLVICLSYYRNRAIFKLMTYIKGG